MRLLVAVVVAAALVAAVVALLAPRRARPTRLSKVSVDKGLALLEALALQPAALATAPGAAPRSSATRRAAVVAAAVHDVVCPEEAASGTVSRACVFRSRHELSKLKIEAARHRGGRAAVPEIETIRHAEATLRPLSTPPPKSLAPTPRRTHGRRRTAAPDVQRRRVFGGTA